MTNTTMQIHTLHQSIRKTDSLTVAEPCSGLSDTISPLQWWIIAPAFSKTRVALGLGLAACREGLPVALATAAASVNEVMEAGDERRLLLRQRQRARVTLPMIDEPGLVPLGKTGAALLFELILQRCERGSTLITSHWPIEEGTETFGTQRLAGARPDRLTHHVNILEMNGEGHRLNQGRSPLKSSKHQTRQDWPDGQCALDRACQMGPARSRASTPG